jgi:hypothetical protein
VARRAKVRSERACTPGLSSLSATHEFTRIEHTIEATNQEVSRPRSQQAPKSTSPEVSKARRGGTIPAQSESPEVNKPRSQQAQKSTNPEGAALYQPRASPWVRFVAMFTQPQRGEIDGGKQPPRRAFRYFGAVDDAFISDALSGLSNRMPPRPQGGALGWQIWPFQGQFGRMWSFHGQSYAALGLVGECEALKPFESPGAERLPCGRKGALGPRSGRPIVLFKSPVAWPFGFSFIWPNKCYNVVVTEIFACTDADHLKTTSVAGRKCPRAALLPRPPDASVRNHVVVHCRALSFTTGHPLEPASIS